MLRSPVAVMISWNIDPAADERIRLGPSGLSVWFDAAMTGAELGTATLVVSVLTLAAAAATLIVVVLSELRQRRDRTNVDLRATAHCVGSDSAGRTLHVWNLTNFGTADAWIWCMEPVNCELRHSDQYQPIRSRVIKSGETAQLAVEADHIGEAWIAIGSAPVASTRQRYLSWVAGEPGPQLRKTIKRSITRWERLRRRLPWYIKRRLIRVRPVGPGAAFVGRVRFTFGRAVSDTARVLSIARPDLGEEEQ
jgi:hypothetical protein